MRWTPFKFAGRVYDLAHLHSRTVTYTQDAAGGKPARHYTADITFSLHCFTRGRDSENAPASLLYSDRRETRIFDFARYALSLRLPGIIEQLMTCKCFHTGTGTYFTVQMLDDAGNPVEYEIYFTVRRAAGPGGISLHVQSAYARDQAHSHNKPHRSQRKPIAFAVILFNTLNNIPIRPPP